MSEETKQDTIVVGEEKPVSYKLPDPVLPKLELPEEPKAGIPESGFHMSCEGEAPATENEKNDHIPDVPPGKIRILIGVCILSYSHEFVQSFLKFWQQLCTMKRGKIQIGYHFVYRKPSHIGEIEIVKVAKFNKCTHILFMDDDIYDITVEDLHKLIDADKEIISGHMYASKFPFASCAFRRYDTNKKVIDMPSDNSMYRLYEVPCQCPECGCQLTYWDFKFCPACGKPLDLLVQPVDLIPLPFALVKVSLFDKLKKPWFHCSENYPTDSWLADRCIEAGVQEYCHMGVRLNHNGISDMTRVHRLNEGLELNKAKGKGLVHLNQEDMDRHQYLLYQKMQEAELKCKPSVKLVEPSEPQTEGVSNECTQDDSKQGIRGETGIQESTVPADSGVSVGDGK